MNYIKKLINAILPILKYLFLSYLVIFLSYIIYYLLGFSDNKIFITNYASYIIVIFNIIYMLVLIKKYKIKFNANKFIIPLSMIGISISSFLNMLILAINKNNSVINMNIMFLIVSSVIIGPLIEEIIFRYILINNLLKFNSKLLSILLGSFIFCIVHTGIFNIIYAFILGIIINIIYLKHKNIFSTLIVHSSANLIVLFLYNYNIFILILSFMLFIISSIILKKEYFK